MKISQLTWSAMAGITLMIAMLGGGLLWVEGATWSARARGERLSEAFRTALHVADVLIDERAATQVSLANPAALDLRVHRDVNRSATDDILRDLDIQLKAAGLGAIDSAATPARGLDLLSALRSKANEALSGPTADRSKLSEDYYTSMNTVLAAMKPIVVPIQTALMDAAGPAVAFDQLALLAVDARISAGGHTGQLGQAMRARRPPTQEETAAMERLAGRVEGLFEQIQASTLQLGSPPAIVAAITKVQERYFTLGKLLFDRQLAAVAAREPYPITAEAFFTDIAPTQQSFQLVRDAAVDEATRRTQAYRQRAELGFAVTALSVAVSAAVTAGFSLMLQRRVLRPIGQLTATMERLAEPDWAAKVLDAGTTRQPVGYRYDAIPAVAQPDEVGLMARAVAVFRNGLLRAEAVTRQQRATQQFLDTVLENVPAPIFVKATDDLTYIHVNRAAEAFAGMSRDDILGKSSEVVMPQDAFAVTEANDLAALASAEAVTERDVRLRTLNNGERLADVTRVVIPGIDGVPDHLLTMINDVTERRQAERRVDYMVNYDALTNLPNRTLFSERLSEAISEARLNGTLVAVLSLDIDDFGEVNEVLGHAVGDTLLCGIAVRLCQCVQHGDVVARVGGDEFAVIQRNLHKRLDTEALAARLAQAIGKPFEIDGHPAFVGVSIGLALSEADLMASDLVKRAGLALREAKESGRGGLRWFVPEMDVRLHTRRTHEHDLRAAIGTSQLTLDYQPQIDLETKAILGAEVLMRWYNPNLGRILPTTFIPIAEETGLIGPLGEWLLAEACAEAVNWPANLSIAVNVSPVQLRMPGFVETVRRALNASGLAATRLELEVTERVLLRDTDGALAAFAELRAMGVKLALDDFGTGYSSLSYLERFRFDKIKIDRSFVTGLADRPEAAAIVRAVLGLCGALGMQAVAEGTETKQEVAALRALGCRQAQGYFFWKPMDALSMRTLAWRKGPAQADAAAD